ncbi:MULTISPECIES: transporter substrate-binding domain-containing protein [Ramlibacter]|uniref:Transporter substrate-binding domain-containing protein n=1 Tax=Ramlibacter pinisoli TaxID=2682844 RepID=A0A6N8IZT8_9BURK|nr:MULTISPECIES: transporter substrate-binding domain-containing protein [Ramlibacter]MBA2961570.1 transporter substrate-binding domain-containing protein [Ramlibacter sp. CGMCC 1.13660]MVQ31513.1 transporter substrate-binding domain-containing protein [Ramlibacter pinisoli]
MTATRRAFSRRLAGLALALPLWLAGCASAPPAVDPAARAALAPTGTLRVALYPGSPSSLVVGRNGERAGVTYELGLLAGKRLAVPVQFVELARAAEVFEAVKAGRADLTFTNASEARMREADFTPALVRVESGYLVSAASGIGEMARIDQAGVRVGVAEGGSSHATLTRELKQARVVPLKSLDAAAQMLKSGELQAFASNKAILYELGDQVPGSAVLPGRWSFENISLAIPRGRPPAALEWTRSFAASLKGSPELQAMISRAGLRGTATD